MKKGLWLASASILLAGVSAPGSAQDNSAAPPASDAVPSSATQGAVGPADSGEIIVTATRRAQALSDVPIAVSAVTGAQLQNSGVTDIRQLNQLSPSLLVSSTTSEAGAGVARIRGIGTVGDNPGLESSVAVFIDGVYRSRTGSGLTELGEVERIEVLRGPQGTLFGRNASAGLINVITKKPSFENEGYAEVTYGNYDHWRVAGGVTGPITQDSLAYRIEGIWQQRDGFYRVEDAQGGSPDRINDRDRWLVRGQLLAQPNDDLEIRIIGDYSKRDEQCCAATYLPTQDVRPDGNGNLLFGPSRVRAFMEALGADINDDTFSRRVSLTPGRDYRSDVEDWGVSAEANWDIGLGKLTSISAYRDWKWIAGQDADFNNLDILYRDSDGGYSRRFQTFSQELRLQGTAFDDRLDWLVGGYFAHEKLKQTDNLSFGADYERFAGCRLAAGLADQLVPVNPAFGAIFNPALAPTSNCFNVPAITAPGVGVISTLNAVAGQATTPAPIRLQLLQAAGALGAATAVPGRPGFGSIAAALGQPTLAINNTGYVDTEFNQTSRNFAFFTHNVFKVTDDLSLTLGVRYTNERKKLDADIFSNSALCNLIRLSPLAALQALPCVINNSGNGTYTSSGSGGTRKESEWSGTAVLSYKVTPDLLTYASYSKGYKAGGFNLDPTGLLADPAVPGSPSLAQLQFAPEKVDAFEIGAKFDGRLFNLNAALFYQRFKNFQLNTFTGTNFIVDNVNGCGTALNGADRDNSAATGACPAGEVEAGVISKGIELEALMLPTDDLTVTAGFTLADTKYRNNLVGAGGRPLVPQLFQLPGNQLSNAPEYVVSGSAAFEPPIGSSGMRGLLYADFRYQSENNTGSDLDPEKRQEGVMVVNARVGVSGPDRRWSFELWGQNLFNVGYQQVAFDAPVQGGGTCCTTLNQVRAGFYPLSDALFTTFLAEPRTYGVTVRTRF